MTLRNMFDALSLEGTQQEVLTAVQELLTDAEIRDALADVLSPVLAQVRDRLPAGGAASEATLGAVRDRLPATGSASEAKLEAVRAIMATLALDATLAQVRDRLPAGGAASEATLGASQAAILAAFGPLALDGTLAAVRDRLPASGAASEAKLEAVRALVALLATEATLAAVLDRQTTIRDTLFRRTDPLASGASIIGYAGNPLSKKAGEGKFFISTTGRVTLAVAGNLRMTFANPNGSGKTIYVARLGGLSTATGFASLILNPTTGLPGGAARPVLNGIAGSGTAAVAVLKADTSAATPLGGGTDTGVSIGFGAGSRLSIDLPPLIIPPNTTLGINVPFTGAAEAEFAIYWYEE